MDTYRNPDTCLYGNVIPCGSVCPGTVSGRCGHCSTNAGVDSSVKGGFGGGDIKLMAVSGFLNGVKIITYAGMLGIILSGIYVSMMLAAGKMGRKDSFALGPFLVMGIIGMKLWTSIS